jgi:hypothetical protein
MRQTHLAARYVYGMHRVWAKKLFFGNVIATPTPTLTMIIASVSERTCKIHAYLPTEMYTYYTAARQCKSLVLCHVTCFSHSLDLGLEQSRMISTYSYF